MGFETLHSVGDSSRSCVPFLEHGVVSDLFPGVKTNSPAMISLFGFTALSLLADPRFASSPRDLDIVELFSGVGSIAQAAQRLGFAAQAFDKGRCPPNSNSPLSPACEDLTVPAGFFNAAALVVRLRVGGLLWMAPVCASWVFYNVSRTKRSASNQHPNCTQASLFELKVGAGIGAIFPSLLADRI